MIANPTLAAAIAGPILRTFAARGVEFIRGGAVHNIAPPGALDSLLLARLRTHKAEALNLLTGHSNMQLTLDIDSTYSEGE